MSHALLVLFGLSFAVVAVFFGAAFFALLPILLVQPSSQRATHAIDTQHQLSRKEGAAPTQAPLQRVDQVVDLARGAGLRHEASGRQNVAAVGAL